MSTLTVSLVQTATHWHDPVANHRHFEALFEQLPADGDLVLLPEMFSTGFTMASRTQAETMTGPTLAWLHKMARQYQRTFCGSIVVRDDKRYFNRLLWVSPEGTVEFYDKRHRFRMAGEHEHYDAGSERLVVSLKGWRICPLICYDLRFPVWSRNSGNEFDLLLYVANWPSPRHEAWQTLLAARAIENQVYVGAVNVVGSDGNNQQYAGGSGVWGFDGARLAHCGADQAVTSQALSLSSLTQYREGFPAWQDGDAFTLNEDNPANP